MDLRAKATTMKPIGGIILALTVVLATGCMRPATVVPEPSEETRWQGAGWTPNTTWRSQNDDICTAMERSRPAVLLLGDSITQGWGGPDRKLSRALGSQSSARWKSKAWLNAGIAGDSLQNAQWRVINGLFDRHQPQTVLVLIGTNNIPVASAGDVLAGIRAIVSQLKERTPRSRIVLMKLLPRGDKTGYEDKIAEVNSGLSTLGVSVLETHEPFTNGGQIRPELFEADRLHLNEAGYETLARIIAPFMPIHAP